VVLGEGTPSGNDKYSSLGRQRLERIFIGLIVGDLRIIEIIIGEYRMRTKNQTHRLTIMKYNMKTTNR
jgi:hypothetical protein